MITWPPRIKLLFFDMFFNVSGTFDTLNEPVLKIYEATFEIWQCTWKGSAPCSYLSPALPFPVSRTRSHFTEGTFVKLEWTLPHFLLVFCRSLHCIIHIGNIHPERRMIHRKYNTNSLNCGINTCWWKRHTVPSWCWPPSSLQDCPSAQCPPFWRW